MAASSERSLELHTLRIPPPKGRGNASRLRCGVALGLGLSCFQCEVRRLGFLTARGARRARTTAAALRVREGVGPNGLLATCPGLSPGAWLTQVAKRVMAICGGPFLARQTECLVSRQPPARGGSRSTPVKTELTALHHHLPLRQPLPSSTARKHIERFLGISQGALPCGNQ
jgi:hypothetical protein